VELTCRSGPTGPGAIASRRVVVERAEAYLRAHMDAPVPLYRLSRIVGLSERGLRNAFYSVRGMSPKRCMLAERLQGVRRALSNSGALPATVTSIATEYGFHELGRFAATYKKTFGETPSETLRRSGRKPAAQITSNTKGQTRCLHELPM
jgi:AraC family ethanolamine operon transcriptional activator